MKKVTEKESICFLFMLDVDRTYRSLDLLSNALEENDFDVEDYLEAGKALHEIRKMLKPITTRLREKA